MCKALKYIKDMYESSENLHHKRLFKHCVKIRVFLHAFHASLNKIWIWGALCLKITIHRSHILANTSTMGPQLCNLCVFKVIVHCEECVEEFRYEELTVKLSAKVNTTNSNQTATKKLKRNSYKSIHVQSFSPLNTHLRLVSTDCLS